jgi:hypothetical protein
MPDLARQYTEMWIISEVFHLQTPQTCYALRRGLGLLQLCPRGSAGSRWCQNQIFCLFSHLKPAEESPKKSAADSRRDKEKYKYKREAWECNNPDDNPDGNTKGGRRKGGKNTTAPAPAPAPTAAAAATAVAENREWLDGTAVLRVWGTHPTVGPLFTMVSTATSRRIHGRIWAARVLRCITWTFWYDW